MRLKLVTATSLLALGLYTTAHAVDINQDGANAVRDNLTKFLPEELAKSGFLTVNPAGTRYEIIYDLAKLLAKANPGELTVNGLTPWSMFATPLDTGLWNIEGNNSLNVSGDIKVPDQKPTAYTYSIASMIYTGVFDPAISYLRSGDFTAKDIKLTSKSDTDQLAAGFDSVNYKLSSTDTLGANGRVDFAAGGKLAGFSETIASQQMPAVEVRADSIDFDAKINALPAKAIREIVGFALEHAKEEKLSKENGDKLKGMVAGAFPLISSINETIALNNLTVTSPAGSGGAKSFGYNFAVDGPSNAMRFGFGLNAQAITLDSPLVPAVYSAFLPDSLDVQFGIPEMDFAAFGNEFMNFDFNGPSPEDSGKKAAEKLFKDGRLVIDFPKVSAKSGVYDIDVSGKLEGRMDSEKDYSMQATVLARDLDKTIAAVQELAKADPDLNQVSFGMMMVKGFAKTDPDGRSRWDIDVQRDGSVSVNGQQIKGADAAEAPSDTMDDSGATEDPDAAGEPSDDAAPQAGQAPQQP